MPAPARVPSFGPNGTHWPSAVPTPWMFDTSPNTVEVACTAVAIQTAIAALTPAQVAAEATVLVQPGTITGAGTGGGDAPVLQNLGDPTWTKRVLVRPRDGYGTVSINTARFLKVHNVAFAGFQTNGMKFQGCRRSALAWTRTTGWIALYGDASVPTVDDFEFVELVYDMPGVDGNDQVDIYTQASNIVRPRVVGCYIAPRYRAIGSSTHNDSLQCEPVSGGTVTDRIIQDTVSFSSSNCADMPKGTGHTFDHSAMLGREYTIARYPIPSGYECTGWSLNGGGANSMVFSGGSIIAKDSASTGITTSPTAGQPMVADVTEAYVPIEPTGNSAHAGWTVEAGCGTRALAESPVPSSDKLISFWTENTPLPGQLSTTGANIALDAATGRATQTARTMYVALLIAAPTDATTLATMTEYAATGYTRQAATFSAPAGDPSASANTNVMTFGPLTNANGLVTITHAALVSAASGTTGDFVYHWQLDSPRTPLVNDSLQFQASALSATLD